MKPFLVLEEDSNTGTDWMKMIEFPFPEDDALDDIDGDCRHLIQQQTLKQKKTQQQMQQ